MPSGYRVDGCFAIYVEAVQIECLVRVPSHDGEIGDLPFSQGKELLKAP